MADLEKFQISFSILVSHLQTGRQRSAPEGVLAGSSANRDDDVIGQGGGIVRRGVCVNSIVARGCHHQSPSRRQVVQRSL